MRRLGIGCALILAALIACASTFGVVRADAVEVGDQVGTLEVECSSAPGEPQTIPALLRDDHVLVPLDELARLLGYEVVASDRSVTVMEPIEAARDYEDVPGVGERYVVPHRSVTFAVDGPEVTSTLVGGGDIEFQLPVSTDLESRTLWVPLASTVEILGDSLTVTDGTARIEAPVLGALDACYEALNHQSDYAFDWTRDGAGALPSEAASASEVRMCEALDAAVAGWHSRWTALFDRLSGVYREPVAWDDVTGTRLAELLRAQSAVELSALADRLSTTEDEGTGESESDDYVRMFANRDAFGDEALRAQLASYVAEGTPSSETMGALETSFNASAEAVPAPLSDALETGGTSLTTGGDLVVAAQASPDGAWMAWDLASGQLPSSSGELTAAEAVELGRMATVVRDAAARRMADELVELQRRDGGTSNAADYEDLARACYVYLKGCLVERESAIVALEASNAGGESLETLRRFQEAIDREIATLLVAIGAADDGGPVPFMPDASQGSLTSTDDGQLPDLVQVTSAAPVSDVATEDDPAVALYSGQPTYLLSRVNSLGPDGTVQMMLDFKYDDVGNLVELVCSHPQSGSTSMVNCFSYDEENNLRSVELTTDYSYMYFTIDEPIVTGTDDSIIYSQSYRSEKTGVTGTTHGHVQYTFDATDYHPIELMSLDSYDLSAEESGMVFTLDESGKLASGYSFYRDSQYGFDDLDVFSYEYDENGNVTRVEAPAYGDPSTTDVCELEYVEADSVTCLNHALAQYRSALYSLFYMAGYDLQPAPALFGL